jgi:chorismate synthase
MALERDQVRIYGGLRGGLTTGGPVGLLIPNAEAAAWAESMDPWSVPDAAADRIRIDAPRPGHADLPGAIKYGLSDMRNVLERASARSTAPRTAAGALARKLLAELGISVRGAVTAVGGVPVPSPSDEEGWRRAFDSPLGCADPGAEAVLIERIDEAAREGDSLGGIFLISVLGLPPGLGSGVEWDRRLDARLGGALLSIPGIKGVEVGEAFASAAEPGSRVHDEILVREGAWTHRTNRAGGIEGGMTNGEELLLRAAMKPIPTMRKPLGSYDVRAGRPASAHAERSDVCAVPAACVVGEAMAAWVLAEAVLEQFGGDTLEELQGRFELYRSRARSWLLDRLDS